MCIYVCIQPVHDQDHFIHKIYCQLCEIHLCHKSLELFDTYCVVMMLILSHFRSFGVHHSVTSLFRTVDLIGRRYLAMLIPSLSQLKLLSYDVMKGEPPSFGSLAVIEANQAIPVQSLSMMLVVGGDKQLTLYSGPHKVATVTVPRPNESESMEASVDSVGVASVRDALSDSFTVELSSGAMMRCALPSPCTHPVGKKKEYPLVHASLL